MTIKHSKDQGQIDALIKLGLVPQGMTKEAMEKEAIVGSLRGLYQGGKALVGRGLMRSVRGGGAVLPGMQASIGKAGRSMYLSGTKNLTSLKNQGKAGILGGRSQVSRSIGDDDLKGLKRFKNFADGSHILKRRQAPLFKESIKTKPAPLPVASSGPISNAPGTPPMAVPSRYASQGTANLGNSPNLPGGSQLLSGAQPPQYARGAFTNYVPPTLPKGPTDQSKTLDWMKANPVLAGAGGLLGYKTLMSNNGSDNIVVGR